MGRQRQVRAAQGEPGITVTAARARRPYAHAPVLAQLRQGPAETLPGDRLQDENGAVVRGPLSAEGAHRRGRSSSSLSSLAPASGERGWLYPSPPKRGRGEKESNETDQAAGRDDRDGPRTTDHGRPSF